MSKLDPGLLAALAHRTEVLEPGEWDAAEHEYLEWVTSGRPIVDGLSREDHKALEARPLTVKAAALRENASERTVYRWIKSGELEAHRVGRGLRIAPDALDRRRIESRKPKSRPEPRKRPTRRRAATAPPGRREFPA